MSQPMDTAAANQGQRATQESQEDDMDIDSNFERDSSPQRRVKRKLHETSSDAPHETTATATEAVQSHGNGLVHMDIDHSELAKHVSKKPKLAHEDAAVDAIQKPPKALSAAQLFIATTAVHSFFSVVDGSVFRVQHSVPYNLTGPAVPLSAIKASVLSKYAIPIDEQIYIGAAASVDELASFLWDKEQFLQDDFSINSEFVASGGILILKRRSIPLQWSSHGPVTSSSGGNEHSSSSTGRSKRHGGAFSSAGSSS